MPTQLSLRDSKTGEIFSVDPSEDRVVIKTSDGDKVRVHPAFIGLMVGIGRQFNGQTLKGLRLMERLK